MWRFQQKERHQNIDDAFVIYVDYKDIDFTNKNILIVDDIYYRCDNWSCSKVLQKHKATRWCPYVGLVVDTNLLLLNVGI